MNAETILHSDVLDIIFENRNKQYGAYPLRKEYDKRLLQAMGAIVTLVLLFCIGNYIQQFNANTFSEIDNIQPRDPVIISSAPPPKPLQPPAKIQAPVAQVKNLPPKIVPDKEVEKPMATNEEMVDKVISNIDQDGPAASTANQQAVSEPVAAGPPVATPPEPAPEILKIAEVMPEFPGGTAALIRFLNKNLQVPENAMEPGEHVRVPVQFVVNKEGMLSDIVFQGTADNAFKKEIQRVLAKMPRWKPGIQNGRTVAVYYTIPVIFDMTEN